MRSTGNLKVSCYDYVKQIGISLVIFGVPYIIFLWYVGADPELSFCSLLGPFSLLPYPNHHLGIECALTAVGLVGALGIGFVLRDSIWGRLVGSAAAIFWILVGFLLHAAASI